MDIIYEKPQTEWEYEAAHDTLIVHLPAEYKKKELRVQVTNTRELWIKAEREGGENKRIRFHLTIPIRDDHDANGITATFSVGKLSVKIPKLKGTVEPKPTQGKPKPEEDVRKSKKEDQEQFADKEAPPTTTTAKPRIGTSTGDGVGKTNGVPSKATDEGKEAEKGKGVIGKVNRLDEQPGVGACKQVFDGLVMVIKNPKRVMNMVLALLLVVVLGLYVKHAFMSMFGETDDIED
ncbi:hypothetical protein SLEP1_g7264 [Rubroshorea leprosula]|uniref:SHSP domain-containing protein n=1 Tax=Rubroshorea leprosula TaxID=152421 RepID=A0AAV5I647_9ROSI|nr:hypothetical protein SLEP1_g7264 [Rubroshorea leprosula]